MAGHGLRGSLGLPQSITDIRLLGIHRVRIPSVPSNFERQQGRILLNALNQDGGLPPHLEMSVPTSKMAATSVIVNRASLYLSESKMAAAAGVRLDASHVTGGVDRVPAEA